VAEQQAKIIFDTQKNVTSRKMLFLSALWIWFKFISHTARYTTLSNTFSAPRYLLCKHNCTISTVHHNSVPLKKPSHQSALHTDCISLTISLHSPSASYLCCHRGPIMHNQWQSKRLRLLINPYVHTCALKTVSSGATSGVIMNCVQWLQLLAIDGRGRRWLKGTANIRKE
jgi:hypothetical protein